MSDFLKSLIVVILVVLVVGLGIAVPLGVLKAQGKLDKPIEPKVVQVQPKEGY